MGTYIATVAQPSGRVLLGYLFRSSDSYVYRVTSSDFIEVNLSNLQGSAREPYRILLEERAPGSYYAAIDVTNFIDGDYILEARELVNTIEYDNILVDNFSVISGEVSSTDITVKITTAPTRALFAYVMSAHSNQHYNAVTKALEPLDLVTSSISERSNFRHSYFEESPSKYILSIDASKVPNGSYYICTYELHDNLEIEAGEKSLIRVQDGKQVIGVEFGNLLVNHNTGGKDNLRYMEANGAPVAGASITLFLANEYAQENYSNPLGRTFTDPSGRWEEPISLEPGATYTVLFQKSGHFGPDSTEVIL